MNAAARFILMLSVFALTQFAAVRADEPPSSEKAGGAASEKDESKNDAPNVLIVGASSLNSPVGQTQLLAAMLQSQKIRMNVDGAYPKLDAVDEILRAKKKWDYVVLDAWHLGRSRKDWGTGRADVPAEFPKALSAFAKEVRDHSPDCKIILFSWWVPSGPKATNEGTMEVFKGCAEHAKENGVWVATTGPAFTEAFLERPDLRITKSKTDGHPGIHGAYLNACSLFAIIADKSPVGLPARLTLQAERGEKKDYELTADDAKYAQEFAWKIYQREIKNTKPAK